MHLTIVNQDAERQLLSFLQQKDLTTWGVLHFQSSSLSLRPTQEEILLTIGPILENKSATVYCFMDGDIVVAWNDVQKNTLETLCSRLYEFFGLIERNLHQYYDLKTEVDALKMFCKQKTNKAVDVLMGTEKEKVFNFELTPEQIRKFREAVYIRNYRARPEMLIVEDQIFSSRLLTDLLAFTYKTHTAINAKLAWKIYLEFAPDIVFLDIELPEISGHVLASEIHKLDPQAFIVMVTGNNYPEDVAKAINNGAKLFVAKPYNRQKIMDAIQKFMLERKNTSAKRG